MNNYDDYYDYETINGDTWDTISLDFYDDEGYSTEIMNENPKYIKVIIFDTGVKLKIPVIEEESKSTLPPWKRNDE
ncbi:phage tail protein X [Gottschalkia purinilytica]|uniref:Phage tail protein X n=1 Tax=Gottschalkia purinilytica TaxID=1503 RepID=A0A0L0WAM0_GOTPU|nr:hypothetical protein [Gottschalkia purinilytica]KNF08558.1 phage tail protein X [Gottschalkia purinilytica]